MISVENFYWVIYENLLKSCKLDCNYFYPFGTTNNLSKDEFNGWKRRKIHPYALFLDQEPLYPQNLKEVDRYVFEENWFKNFKILANSEISNHKQIYCKSREFSDWYFFYHGFAALDWFQDCRYVTDSQEITNGFLCLNHLIKNKRSYRMSLLARMIESGAAQKGMISFHANADACQQELQDPYSELSELDKQLIRKHLCNPSVKFPWVLDHSRIDANFSARAGYHEYKLWQSSLFHVVTETVFYDQKLHLTEKIFKPIVSERPFILVAAPGNLSYLKSYGFKTFDRWINEDYDLVQDNDTRLNCISNEIQKLSEKSLNELKDMHHEMRDILKFNKHHFYNEFQNIIVDELVDNFEKCLEIWNNGRVKYQCPPHPDLQSVKNLFKR